jgi:putative membrane protein
MMWWYGYPGAGMAAWMIISSVIWLAIIGAAVWAFVRWVSAHTQASTSHPSTMGPVSPSAHEILRQRYARGEIDEQTFVRMQARLDASSPHEPRQEMLTEGSRAP